MLRRLEYLVALAREGHFARAAAACHVTQPTLSSGLRRLEAELGVPLVHRGQRFGGLTPEGVEVVRWARRVLAERQALDQALSGMRGGLSGTLRIGAIPTALSVASMLTAPLREQHPSVGFRLMSMSSRDIVERLNDFEIDVGMTYLDGEPLGKVRTVPLYREHYLLLTPADGSLGDRDAATWAEAAAQPLCLLTPDMQNRRIIDAHLGDTGVETTVVVETDTVSALYAHVAAMGLSSIVPQMWLPSFGVPAGSRAVALPSPSPAHQVGLVLAAHGPESLLTRALLDVARAVDLSAVAGTEQPQDPDSTRSGPE